MILELLVMHLFNYFIDQFISPSFPCYFMLIYSFVHLRTPSTFLIGEKSDE